ncbi:hypothetical protein ANRL1_04713 [Anaerolineae bacterium]|nr:hypothetical protein ANRL1_04713 [Anaerolineae bacterium]
MNEQRIRKAIIQLFDTRANSSSLTAAFEEMRICGGRAIADLAVANGKLEGFEIKSDADSLRRLPLQQKFYQRVFERMVLVTTLKHLHHARKQLPSNWGLWLATQAKGKIRIRKIRSALPNFRLKSLDVLALLRRSEALEVAMKCGIPSANQLSKRKLLEKIRGELCAADVVTAVRNCLKSRSRRAFGFEHVRDGVKRQSSSKSMHSRGGLEWLLSFQSAGPQR